MFAVILFAEMGPNSAPTRLEEGPNSRTEMVWFIEEENAPQPRG